MTLLTRFRATAGRDAGFSGMLLSPQKTLIVILRAALARELVTHYLETKMQLRVAATSPQAGDAARLTEEFQPDAIILEHPLEVALQSTLRKLRGLPRPVPVILFARVAPDLAAFRGDCTAGQVSLDDGLAAFDETVRRVLEGGGNQARLPGPVPGRLTDRQDEILRMLVKGCSTKDVARELGLSFKTADHHRTRLMRKLNSHSVAELIRNAIGGGIVDLSS